MPKDLSTGVFLRIGQFLSRFSPNEPIRRVDVDEELNDFADAISDNGVRIVFLEEHSLRTNGNLLLNALFEINTLTYDGSSLDIGDYGFNRWRAGATGTIYTVTDQVMTISAGSVEQLVDGRSILGGDYTITWEGTATAMVNGVTVESGDQVALVADVDLIVSFEGGTVSKPQVMFGTVALPFRPLPYELDFILCRVVLPFPFDAAVTTAFIHESVLAVSTFGETSVATGRRRVFKRVSTDPGEVIKLQSADGTWWEYIPPDIAGSSAEARISALEEDVEAIEIAIAGIISDVTALAADGDTRLSAIESDILDGTILVGNGSVSTAGSQLQTSYPTSEQVRIGYNTGAQRDIFISIFSGLTDRRGYFQGRSDRIRIGSDFGAVLDLRTSGVAELNGAKVWTAANDGATSGLDADLLDGSQGSAYLKIANLGAEIGDLAEDDRGTYVLARYTPGSSVNFGAVISGSVLLPASASDSVGATSLPGSYMCCGRVSSGGGANRVSLFRRI